MFGVFGSILALFDLILVLFDSILVLFDLSHTPSIILDFCPTNLKRCIKKLTDEERIDIIIQFSSAMKEVHSVGIIHRDLKLENILLDENHQVKLCVFGLCKLLSPEKQATTFTQIAGTIKYMEPELIQEKKILIKKSMFMHLASFFIKFS